MLPDAYIKRIKEELLLKTVGQGQESTKIAYASLSQRYRESNASGFRSKAEMAAYVDARFPATFSVVDHILKSEIPDKSSIQSTLDLGAGPGTATLASFNHFSLSDVTLIEQTPEFVAAVNAVLTLSFPSSNFNFSSESVHSAIFPKSDLVLLSYLLTEMSETQALKVYEKSLNATNAYNLVVLPGTSVAFKLLLRLRDLAIALGYRVLAPCPHMHACPMAIQAEQWCHFRQRLSRSREHQNIKGGTMGYEDEPYCYLLVSPADQVNAMCEGRVVNTPKHRPGHIYVDVCAESGMIETQCMTKKDKNAYKAAKNLNWGDWV